MRSKGHIKESRTISQLPFDAGHVDSEENPPTMCLAFSGLYNVDDFESKEFGESGATGLAVNEMLT